MKISWKFDKLIEIMKRNTFNYANVNCAYCSTTASAVAVNSLLPCRDVCVRVSETRSNLLLFLCCWPRWNEMKRNVRSTLKIRKFLMGIPFQIILYGLCRITHTHTPAHTHSSVLTLKVNLLIWEWVCQLGEFVKLNPYQRVKGSWTW